MHSKDEIDFKDLLKQPLRLFGVTYVYFLMLGGLLGVYYLWTLNESSFNSVQPVVLKDSAQFVSDVPMQRGGLIAPVNVAVIAKPTKELIAKGANLYKSNCASCHGDNGMGDGLSAAALTVKPRSFHSSTEWKNGSKISNIYRTLQDGILVSGMPAFNYNPAEDRFAMIHFIRSLTSDYPVDSLSELMELEKQYNLSKGSQLPAQIPVKIAIQKIIIEHENDVKSVEKIGDRIKVSSDADAGVKLALKISTDPKKLASTAFAVRGKNFDEFVKIVSADPHTLGFKPEVVRLSSGEWNSLYSFFTQLGIDSKKL